MNVNDKINYVEFPARYIEGTKAFFGTVFGVTNWPSGQISAHNNNEVKDIQ